MRILSLWTNEVDLRCLPEATLNKDDGFCQAGVEVQDVENGKLTLQTKEKRKAEKWLSCRLFPRQLNKKKSTFTCRLDSQVGPMILYLALFGLQRMTGPGWAAP